MIKVRPILLGLHRYLGLFAAVLLVIEGLSGGILAFEVEIDRALNRSYWTVTPQGRPQSWEELIGSIGREYPGDPVVSLRLPPAPQVAAELSLKSGLLVTADPYTGKVLGARRREQILTTRIHQFHTRLLLGPWAGNVTGAGALILSVLALTGLPLWWRRKTFGVKWRAPWRRINYDGHFAVGVYLFLPWLILGLTGAVMAFEGVSGPAVYWLTRSRPAPMPTLHGSKAPSSNRRFSPDAALAVAAQALPGAGVTVISIPQNPSGVYLAYMKFPEDHTPAGRSRVGIDPFTGSILGIISSRTAPAGTRLLNLNRPIHTGDVFGWPTRVLACLASVLLALQAISGLLIWWGTKGPASTR